jgi:hypothetical protein
MPVARTQLQELVDIMMEELGPDGKTKFRRIMLRFKRTEAYRANRSFKETIDRFLIATRIHHEN